jgi:hypothetical protein
MFTKQTADVVFLRPCLAVDLLQSDSVERACEWLARIVNAPADSESQLHIAGPRESEAPGIYARERAFIAELIACEYI